MANLLIFIHKGGIYKLLYSPDFKKVLISLVTLVGKRASDMQGSTLQSLKSLKPFELT